MPDPDAPHSPAQPPSDAPADAPLPAAESPAPPDADPAPDRRPATRRRWLVWAAGAVLGALLLIEGIPWLITAVTTVSTDDAFVNGHVTIVAPRVPGQVVNVLVDDNKRVRTGDLLVQLDKDPYQVEVDIARAAVASAEAGLVVAQADVRGLAAQARSQRFKLARAIEGLDNQVAMLRERVATLKAQKATVSRARADYERERPLVKEGVVSKQEFDAFTEANLVAEAQLEKVEQEVYAERAKLGLQAKPKSGADLTHVPVDLSQTYSSVKDAQMQLMETAAQLGVEYSFDTSPQQMLEDFYKRDAQGNIDRILGAIMKDAPAVKQAEAKLAVAKANLDQAELNLRYCDVVAEIDGVVTRRSVNPGDHVLAGQSMMALRSLTEIWIDANFKETQLRKLRIGQPVDIDVDMYGAAERFRGRISGFTMGTGSTLALLPPENATGNFVKVVQRLPVRIELLDYDPDKQPLFVGLSVTPYVHVNEKPTGPNAGRVLQAYETNPGSVPAEPK